MMAAGHEPARADRESPVADTDLSAEFEKTSDKAKAATDELKSAGHRTRDQLEADVASARQKATAAADQVQDTTDAERDKASSHWQEMRGKWQAHVANVRANAKQKKHQLDAD
jgi:hypothetical protein